jgi:hypothetical protein
MRRAARSTGTAIRTSAMSVLVFDHGVELRLLVGSKDRSNLLAHLVA